MKNTDSHYDRFKKVLNFLYTTVTSISSNPDKNEFIVADSSGNVSHFNLETLKLNKIVDAHKNAIYSTLNHGDDFFTGSLGCVKRWNFSNVSDNLECEYKFVKNCSKALIKPYINDMVVVKNYLLAATCRGLESFDLETNKKTSISNYKNTSPLYCVEKHDENTFVASGLNGIVSLYDIRTPTSAVSEIHMAEEFPELTEKYINCLAVDDRGCIVCGGGSQLSMWHMSSKTKILSFEIPSNTQPSTIIIYNNKISIGTSSGRLLQFDYSGNGIGSIDTSLLTVDVLHPIQKGQYTDCYFLAGRLPEIHIYTENLQHVDTIYLSPPHVDT